MLRLGILFSLLLFLVGCSDSDSGEESTTTPDPTASPTQMEPTSPPEEIADTARYTLSFEATWSAETHMTNFPSGPHFSGLVGAVHSEQVIFWESGQIATAGVELMAETGAKSIFLDEINLAIADGKANAAIDTGGIALSPGSVSVEFEVNRDFPRLTVTSMLAPSPDWFVGINGLSLLDENGNFIDEVSVDLALYDAGTDSGAQYASANDDTQPRDIIQRLTQEPSDGPFIDGLPQVGRFLIQKM